MVLRLSIITDFVNDCVVRRGSFRTLITSNTAILFRRLGISPSCSLIRLLASLRWPGHSLKYFMYFILEVEGLGELVI